MPNTYVFGPAEAPLIFAPTTDQDTVRILSRHEDRIEDAIATIELAGPEYTKALPKPEEIGIDNDYDPRNSHYCIDVSRATLSIFLEFETRYYMFVTPEGA